jgi:integrase
MHGVRPAAKNRVITPHTLAFPPISLMLLLAKR